ncbi:SusC/RagA family TonB-linked outer membrane protein [Mucilaginibacter daejeonensis]|uniref:SusC/RagA family TonB-linked outer membrane protein n=1 Tax=Mucilaginibacter daejeonensis TaxID=398049 RepID=UPI001D174622|nr:SusC/RagA family TonB-linked outer membrane protein [Mucilaginibacter daejeonensis]UEG51483.1 SusC/RagA family TonB-linked outer membrane protein [Mucilaginibacter daejeonensis]
MKRLITYLILFVLTSITSVFAQTPIKGKVFDNTGLPLAGVTIKVSGGNTATQTDVNGNYSINAPQGASITYTYVGFVNQIITVGADRNIDIKLMPTANNLNDVVVVGYGTRAVKDVTGAISSIKADRLENENPTSVTDIIRGNIPGVSVAFNTSAKGGGTGDLQVRGKASLSGNVQPLIVLDGVIYFGQLADINPNDIDRIDVLRDPSALAVYGAQSAGGVVAITTKKGRNGAPRITLNANFGIAQLAKNQKFYQGEDFLNWRADAARSANTNNPYYFYSNPNALPDGVSLAQFMGSSTGDPTTVWLTRLGLFNNEINNYKNGKVTDWSKLIFRNGIRQDYTASLSGASETVKYYFSGNYTKNQNLINGGYFRDGRIRVNLEGKVAKFLTIGANSQFSSRDESGLTTDNNPFNLGAIDRHEADWTQIINSSPYGDLYNADGSLRRIATDDSGLNQRNPFLGMVYNDNVNIQNVLFSNLFARVDLPFGIKYNLNFSPQIESYRDFFFRPGRNPNEIAVNNLSGTAYRSMENRYRYNLDNILTWNKTFGQHNFDVTALLNKEKYNTWYTRTNNSQFSPTDVLGYHNIGAGTLPVESSDDRVYNASGLMGRLNYTFKGRYILTGTFRRDGFSVFGLNNPYGYYPSGAVAWVFSDEGFMKKDGLKWLNYGKLRVTYGANGNRFPSGTADPSLALATMNINRYPTQDGSGTVTNNTAIYVATLQNQQLKWERTVGTNVGLDFTVLNNRLSGSIDVYNRNTTDLLVRQELPWVQGYNNANNIQIGGSNANSRVSTNIGEVNNKGIEVSLDGKIIKSRNFNWSATGTFFLNRNKIKHLYGEYQTTDANGNAITRENDDIGNGWFIGHDINAVWDYKILGVWQQSDATEIAAINAKTGIGLRPGDFKLEDVNGDQRWDNNDKQFLGSESPKFTWSFRNDINFLQNFDFSLMLISNIGQLRQYNQARNNPGSVGFLRMNSYVQPYWTPDNPINDYARLSSGQSGTTVNVWRKASFVRIQNVSLGYTIPQDICKRLGVQNAKVFINATNPYVMTGWQFWDPQNDGPTPRFFAAGFNLNF